MFIFRYRHRFPHNGFGSLVVRRFQSGDHCSDLRSAQPGSLAIRACAVADLEEDDEIVASELRTEYAVENPARSIFFCSYWLLKPIRLITYVSDIMQRS